jgi:hypothetical protein
MSEKNEESRFSLFEWLKGVGAGLLVWVLKSAIWRILVKILEKADTEVIANSVRPHLRKLYAQLGPDAQVAITAAIKKLAEFAQELLEDKTVGS